MCIIERESPGAT
ncbi:hypothetical protein MTR67_005023 [Solanum verrucosum]|uniref:Uncharacterized protein n=1 Tax=Solanum verrucosum TaxID=315347 RepID=A0AAF0PV68_SOLVR|nr:hypothetical protein MTR67_005023 [Solanum verrucosum]